ncbi:MAG: c-type cytochrome [Candidatus Anammoxibacter sp.]
MKRVVFELSMLLSFFVMIGTFSGLAVRADQDTVNVFNRKCAKCHGREGNATKRGIKLGAENFKDVSRQKSITDEEIINVISNGKNKMPGWKDKLDQNAIKNLVHYVRVLLPRGERKKMPKNIQMFHYGR